MSENAWNAEEASSVSIKVNSEVKGTVPSTSLLNETVQRFAREAGLRSFSVYLDGNDATPEQGDNSLSGISEVELVAKDTRG